MIGLHDRVTAARALVSILAQCHVAPRMVKHGATVPSDRVLGQGVTADAANVRVVARRLVNSAVFTVARLDSLTARFKQQPPVSKHLANALHLCRLVRVTHRQDLWSDCFFFDDFSKDLLEKLLLVKE